MVYIELEYVTADNLAILPENDEDAVKRLAIVLGFDLDMIFKLEGVNPDFKHPFPTPCTVREALSKYCDIHGALRPNMLTQLIPYVQNAGEREWLKSIVSKEGRQDLKHLVEDKHRTLVDLISTELSSCQIPFVDFLHIIPHLQPRYYTISSSSSLHPKTVHATVAVTEYREHSGGIFHGVCSNYMRHLAVNGSCKAFIKASTFRLPSDANTPIIMVGPGTGIAPMRALLQEREYQRQNNGSTGRNTLFFGCKHAHEDYIYRDELEGYQSREVLSSLHLAFSRDQKQKVGEG